MPLLTSGRRKPARPALGSGEAVATVRVRDVRAARKFYEDVLGLTPGPDRSGDAVAYEGARSRVFVYASPIADEAPPTSITWICDDVDATVGALRARGVVFEHYDLPGVRCEGDVHVVGNRRAAWFRDPDGNVLAIVSG
jgi:catechol 2,3-dioxygenase-like lactoylglutathione lyase family enzyme